MRHLRRALLLAPLILLALLVPSLPASADARPGCVARDHWTVKKNEYIDLIARRTCTTRDAVMTLNPWLESRRRYEAGGELNVIIHPGERIVTARRVSVTPAPRPTPDRRRSDVTESPPPAVSPEPAVGADVSIRSRGWDVGDMVILAAFVLPLALLAVLVIVRMVRRSRRPRGAAPKRRWLTRANAVAAVAGLQGGSGAGLGLTFGLGLGQIKSAYHLSATTTALLVAAAGFVTVLMLVGVGPRGDRFDKRKLILINGTAATACFALFPYMPNVWLKLLCAAGAGLAGANDPWGRSLLETRRPLEGEEHGRRNSVLGAFFLLGLLFTATFPSLLQLLGTGSYWVIAGVMVVLLVAARLVLPADQAATLRPPPHHGALRSAARNPVVQIAAVLAAVNGAALGVQVAGAMALILAAHGFASGVAGAFAGHKVPAVLLLPRLRHLTPRMAAIAMSILPFAVAGVALAPMYTWIFVCAYAVALALLDVTTNVLWNGVMERTPAPASAKSLVIGGRVFGANVVGAAVGVLVHGWLEPRGVGAQDGGVLLASLGLSLLSIPIAARFTAMTRPMEEVKRIKVKPDEAMQVVKLPVRRNALGEMQPVGARFPLRDPDALGGRLEGDIPFLLVGGRLEPLDGGRLAVAVDGSGAPMGNIRIEALGALKQGLAPPSRFVADQRTDAVKGKLRLTVSPDCNAVFEAAGRAPLVSHEGSMFRIVGAESRGSEQPYVAEVVIRAPAPRRLGKRKAARLEDNELAGQVQRIAMEHGALAAWPRVWRKRGIRRVHLVLRVMVGRNLEEEIRQAIEHALGGSTILHIEVRGV